MSVEVSLRPFRAEDSPRLQQIREAAFRPGFRSFRNMVGEDISASAFATAEAEQATLLNDLCTPGASEEVFVAEMGSDLVGFVAISLDRSKSRQPWAQAAIGATLRRDRPMRRRDSIRPYRRSGSTGGREPLESKDEIGLVAAEMKAFGGPSRSPSCDPPRSVFAGNRASIPAC